MKHSQMVNKNNISNKNMHFISVIVALLVFSLILFLALADGGHKCTGEHCIVCLTLSNSYVLNVFVCTAFVICVSLCASVSCADREKTKETLITLKSKLTN